MVSHRGAVASLAALSNVGAALSDSSSRERDVLGAGQHLSRRLWIVQHHREFGAVDQDLYLFYQG
jgi:hypothetical protein